jgi:hypothetical protein
VSGRGSEALGLPPSAAAASVQFGTGTRGDDEDAPTAGIGVAVVAPDPLQTFVTALANRGVASALSRHSPIP